MPTRLAPGPGPALALAGGVQAVDRAPALLAAVGRARADGAPPAALAVLAARPALAARTGASAERLADAMAQDRRRRDALRTAGRRRQTPRRQMPLRRGHGGGRSAWTRPGPGRGRRRVLRPEGRPATSLSLAALESRMGPARRDGLATVSQAEAAAVPARLARHLAPICLTPDAKGLIR